MENLEDAFTRATALMPVVLACGLAMRAQDGSVPQLTPGEARAAGSQARSGDSQMIALHPPVGTPMQVMLADEVRVQKIGSRFTGGLWNRCTCSTRWWCGWVGSDGKIVDLEHLRKKRTLAAFDADFTPAREVQVEFDDARLAGGNTFRSRPASRQGRDRCAVRGSPTKRKKEA